MSRNSDTKLVYDSFLLGGYSNKGFFLAYEAVRLRAMRTKASQKTYVLNGWSHHPNPKIEAIGSHGPELGSGITRGVYRNEVLADHDGIIYADGLPELFLGRGHMIKSQNILLIGPWPQLVG